MGTYIYMMATAVAVLLPAYALVRWLYCRRRRRRWTAREVPLALFVVFFAGLLFMVTMALPWMWMPGPMLETAGRRIATGEGINLVPFSTIGTYVKMVGWWGSYGFGLFAVNVLGNVLMFVPIGVGLPLLWQRWQRWWKMLLWAVGLPVCIEVVQLFIGRSVDVDDVLLNLLGILAGFWLYLLGRRLVPALGRLALPRRPKAQQTPRA